MIKQLEPIYSDQLPMELGLSMNCGLMLTTKHIKSIAPIINDDSEQYRGLCIYFTDDTSSPDIILDISNVDEFTEYIENIYRRNQMKVVKLNFNKEDNHEV